MRYASTLQPLLGPEGDLVIPVVIPGQFLDFAKGVLERAFEDRGIRFSAERVFVEVVNLPPTEISPYKDVLVFWRITTLSMWQQIDRRIDE